MERLFLNGDPRVEMSKLNQIYLIIRQKHFKNITGVDIPKFVRKVDLARLKSEIDKLDTGNEKLEIRYYFSRFK